MSGAWLWGSIPPLSANFLYLTIRKNCGIQKVEENNMTKEIPVYIIYKYQQVFGQQIDKIFLNKKKAEEYKNSFNACCQPFMKEKTLTIDENDILSFNESFT